METNCLRLKQPNPGTCSSGMWSVPVVNCLLCGGDLCQPLSPEDALCALCRALAYPGDSPAPTGRCRLCHEPLLGEQDQCSDCARHRWSFSGIEGLFPYHGPSGELVRAYKGRQRAVLADHWARQLALRIQTRGVLVPVPAHRQHLRERGWDPVERLCHALGRRTGFPVVNALRRRNTLSQKLLGRGVRHANALNSYVAARAVNQVDGKVVWLVDDVVTTGWTAEACTRLLLVAGACEVRVLCLCLH